jgi:hypothetical protein
MGLSMKEKQKIITGYRSRYRKAGRKEKTAILNEVRFITGYNRKYALRILNQPQAPQAPARCQRQGGQTQTAEKKTRQPEGQKNLYR